MRTKQPSLTKAAAAAGVNGNGKPSAGAALDQANIAGILGSEFESVATGKLNGVPVAPLLAEAFAGDELVRVKIGALATSPLNPRKSFERRGLEELAASIRAVGILEPIIVREHPQRGARPSYEIVAGERRVRAAEMAGLAVVPAIVRKLTDRQVLEMQVIENEQRADVPPLEKADGYHALTKLGVSPEDIGKRVGVSESTIRNLLKLRQLPELARKAIERGNLPVSVAALIARVPGEKTRGKVALHVLAGEPYWNYTPKPGKDSEPLSYRQTKELIESHCMIELKGAAFDREMENLAHGAATCSRCPKRAGNLKQAEPENYAGVRDDVCTDPECFAEKTNAWNIWQIDQAKANGTKLLSKAESKEVFSQWNDSQLAHDADYVDLKTKCFEDPKRRTWEALLGPLAAKEQVIAVDHDNRLRSLAPKAAALKALKAKGIGKGKRDVARSTEDVRQAKEEAALKAKEKAGKAAALKAHALIVDKIRGMFVDHLVAGEMHLKRMRTLAREIVRFSGSDAERRVTQRRGVADLGAEIERMATFEDLLGLMAELAIARVTYQWGHRYYDNDPAEQRDLWDAWGIDKAALMREAAAEGKRKS